MAETQEWYYMNGEDQLGPVSPEELQQLAAAGHLLPETPLWTEGLEEWVQATQVEGLFPEPVAEVPHPHLVVGAEAQAAHPLAGEVLPGQAPQVAGTYAPPQAAAGYAPQVAGVPGAAAPQVAPPQAGQIAAPGENYPPPGPMKASFHWFVTLPLVAILGLIGGGVVIYLRLKALMDGTASGTSSMTGSGGMSFIMEMAGVFYGSLLLFGLCFLLFTIFKVIVLYRAWAAIQYGGARTTPGKAIGLLFIPFFKFYWMFVAYLGLAKDWNRIHASHPNLVGAPRMSEGLVLTYCITSLIYKVIWWGTFFINLGSVGEESTSNPLGIPMLGLWLISLIFEIIFLAGVCRLVNYMGKLHIQQAQPRPGGLQFY